MAQEPALTFETFTSSQDDSGIPYFDNFPLFFANGALSEHYRTLPPYVGLKKETPSLEARLKEGISKLPNPHTSTLKPFYRDLHEAYLIMRKYVDSDTKLGLPPAIVYSPQKT